MDTRILRNSQDKLKAFTLAEVLITLVIIGVVAALTIPSLVTNYKKNLYVTQLKKEYNYLTNGFKKMMADEGVFNLSDTKLWQEINKANIDYVRTAELLSNPGIKDEFLKHFNVAAMYNSTTIPADYKAKIKDLNGKDSGNMVNEGIYLSDGAYLGIYLTKNVNFARCGSRSCASLKEFQANRRTGSKYKLWSEVGGVDIDVNGPKGPNQYGRDYFEFLIGNDGVLYPIGGMDYPVFLGDCANYKSPHTCGEYWDSDWDDLYRCDTRSSGEGCAGRVIAEGWKMNY